MPLHNAKIDQDEMETIRKGYPELLQKIDNSTLSFLHEIGDKSIWEATPEEREAFWEFLYAQPGFGFWISNYKETMTDRKANALLSEFVAKKIRERVKDPWTADKLTPKTYGKIDAKRTVVDSNTDRIWSSSCTYGDLLLRGFQ